MSLRHAAASGVVWTAAATIVSVGLRLVSLAVIARHLAHDELGIVTMLVAIVATMQAFGDFGLNAVIVQRRGLATEQLSSLFWLAQLTGIAILVAIIALEPAIVAFYGDPRLDGYVPWLAARFVVAPVGLPFQAILQRDMQFRRLFVLQAGPACVGAAVTVALAITNHGIWSLVLGELALVTTQSLVALALGWTTWHPILRFRREDLRGPLRVGAYQVGERALNLFATSIDYILIGRVLGASALGVYAIAFELVSLPARLNSIVNRVALPLLAQQQDEPAQFRAGFLELMRVVALVQLPVAIAIGAFAPLLVPVAFGDGWHAAVPLVQILSAFGAIRVLGNPSGPTFLAKGRADIGFRFNLVVAVVALAAFALTVRHGVEAVAWTWVALGALQLAALLAILTTQLEIRAVDWHRALLRPALIAALAIVLFVGAVHVAERTDLPRQLQLALALALGALAFIPLALRIERSLVRSVFAALRRNRSASAGSATSAPGNPSSAMDRRA